MGSAPVGIGATGSTEEAYGHLQVTQPNAGLDGDQDVFERIDTGRPSAVPACV